MIHRLALTCLTASLLFVGCGGSDDGDGADNSSNVAQNPTPPPSSPGANPGGGMAMEMQMDSPGGSGGGHGTPENTTASPVGEPGAGGGHGDGGGAPGLSTEVAMPTPGGGHGDGGPGTPMGEPMTPGGTTGGHGDGGMPPGLSAEVAIPTPGGGHGDAAASTPGNPATPGGHGDGGPGTPMGEGQLTPDGAGGHGDGGTQVTSAPLPDAKKVSPREAIESIRDLQGIVVEAEGKPQTVNLIGRKNFNNQQAQLLASLTGVQKLFLADSGISGGALKYVAKLNTLEELVVSGISVTDADLKHIAGLSNLKRLNLSKTRVTNEGLRVLAGLSKLEQLTIEDTAVTQAGVDQTKTVLPNVKITWSAASSGQTTSAGQTVASSGVGPMGIPSSEQMQLPGSENPGTGTPPGEGGPASPVFVDGEPGGGNPNGLGGTTAGGKKQFLPNLRADLPSYVAVQLVRKVINNENEGIAALISPSAKGFAAQLRAEDNTEAFQKATEMMANLEPVNSRTANNGEVWVLFRMGKDASKVLRMTVRKIKGEFKIQDIRTLEGARR